MILIDYVVMFLIYLKIHECELGIQVSKHYTANNCMVFNAACRCH